MATTKRAKSAQSPVTGAPAENGHGELPLAERIRLINTAGAKLIADLMDYFLSFVVVTPEQALVLSVWVIHTYCFEAFEHTPYLAISSPEKQCGKTTLMMLLMAVVNCPDAGIAPTEASLFRSIDIDHPTLLWDEVDTIFNPTMEKFHQGKRAILNAGNRRGFPVKRTEDFGQKIVYFDVFCPKVLAGIGTFPDTIADRSIPMRMERKRRDQEVERGRQRLITRAAAPFEARIEAWLDGKRRKRFEQAEPALPDELDDRAQDCAEPLCALADEARCGSELRRALLTIYTGERVDSQDTMRRRLLKDLRDVWLAHETLIGKRASALRSQLLVNKLKALGEGPWTAYYTHGFRTNDLASLLGHYGVKPKPIYSAGELHVRPRGYRRDDVFAVIERYVEQGGD